MEFENQLPEELCEVYFQNMFEKIWKQDVLEDILFSDGFHQSAAYQSFMKQNEDISNGRQPETELQFLAHSMGCSLWEVFSNNHTVFSIEKKEDFSIGSWRGSGSFIASFIESQNRDLQFDYLDFYMGHFRENPETKKSFAFIFTQLKTNGFDWQYEYPQLGIVDFSVNQKDMAAYNPNEAMATEQNTNELLKKIEDINEETKRDIQSSATPVIILAYANVYGLYPSGWIE